MRGGNSNVNEVGVMGEEKLAGVVLVQIVITIAKQYRVEHIIWVVL